VTPNQPQSPIGLAALAAALAEWHDLDEVVADLYAARETSRDRSDFFAD